MLVLHSQPSPRRDQDLQLGGRVEDLGHQPHAPKEVLEVVQDQEHTSSPEVAQQLLPWVTRSKEGEADSLGHGGHDAVGRPERGQRDEVDAVLEVVEVGAGRLQGQAPLPLPPAPTSVNGRQVGSRNWPAMSASAASRPTKGMGWAGRLCRGWAPGAGGSSRSAGLARIRLWSDGASSEGGRASSSSRIRAHS